ncbi:MAG: hypothetical protein LUG18_13375 [Candidatus Azobacteroides sp.]|nr:hypothetical protein [Candidatus Azobacteroides sp.]
MTSSKGEGFTQDYYTRLLYNEESLLTGSFMYRINQETNFEYGAYTFYTIQSEEGKYRIKNISYDTDTVPDPAIIILSSFPYVSVIPSEDPLQEWKFKCINGIYKPIETLGYIDNNRNRCLTYDEKGYITSETWYL